MATARTETTSTRKSAAAAEEAVQTAQSSAQKTAEKTAEAGTILAERYRDAAALATDLEAARQRIVSGELVAAVERVVGPLEA